MAPRGLSYLRGDEWAPIPSWARFFVELGERLGSETAAGVRAVAGVTLPIRSYAAALAAAGIVAARSSTPVSPADPQDYFRWLSKLPVGTPVCLTLGDREYKGVFLGCEETSCGPLAGVQVEKTVKGAGGLRRWFPPESAKRIRRLDKDISADNLPKSQGGKTVLSSDEVVRRNRFAQGFLAGADVYDFVTSSRLDCLIAGRTGVLRQEIKETPFALQGEHSRDPVEGTLQEILRVRKFSGANDGYRANVVYANSRATHPARAEGSVPAVVVFDGATSFANLRHEFRSSTWIVLIDRTERMAEEAIDLLNGEYLQYRIEDRPKAAVPDVPAGIELSIFHEEVG